MLLTFKCSLQKARLVKQNLQKASCEKRGLFWQNHRYSTQKFQPVWCDHFKWLEYSDKNDVMTFTFCKARCVFRGGFPSWLGHVTIWPKVTTVGVLTLAFRCILYKDYRTTWSEKIARTKCGFHFYWWRVAEAGVYLLPWWEDVLKKSQSLTTLKKMLFMLPEFPAETYNFFFVGLTIIAFASTEFWINLVMLCLYVMANHEWDSVQSILSSLYPMSWSNWKV